MHLKINAAIGAIVLAAATMVPAGSTLADSIRSRQWYLSSLKVSEAQAISKGAGIVVAIVDTGTYPHPDLKRNLLVGANVTSGTSGGGQSDQDGHGTSMAAIIGAHGGPGNAGVLGIAPSSKILPVKISNSVHSMPAVNMATGIDWATEHGAKVINVSAGAGPAFELQKAVTSAISSNVVVVAAVGNTSEVGYIPYPAAMNGVLTVGAVGRNLKHASGSLDDPKVQLCAPGIDIISAAPKDKYVSIDGTSPATAVVSGAAALVRAKFPQLSAPEVIHRLTATADDIGPPGRDKECGFGLLNIVKALTADVPPLSSSASASPSATATSSGATPASDSGTDTAAGAPGTENTGSSAPAVIGVVLVVLVVAALVGLLVLRRRRSP